MQDYLPDVNQSKKKLEENLESNQVKEAKNKKIEKPKLDAKQLKILIVSLLIGGFLILGITISILESKGYGKDAQSQVQVEKKLEERPLLVEQKPGQMQFLFYKDDNLNGVFDYSESRFIDVSVEVRRIGEPQAFRTQASDVDGRVLMSDLDEGTYQVRFVNHELDQVRKVAEFEIPKAYELVSEEKVKFEFLPSAWQEVKLEGEGYKSLVGVRDYQPKSVLALSDGNQIYFYDPYRSRVFIQSHFEDNLKRKFVVADKEVYYLKDNKLFKFSLVMQTSIEIMPYLFGVDAHDYYLSPQKNVIVFAQDEYLNYKTKDGFCGEGGLSYEGRQLKLKQDMGLGVDFWGDNQFVFVGFHQDLEPQVFLASCEDEDGFEVKPLDLKEVISLGFLNENTLFYSSYSGSYFYDIENDSLLKYSALQAPSKVVFSDDKKYISAVLGSENIIVDYPAVKSSGVEKHYITPFLGEITFFGDEVLINQTKKCQSDGDCGQVGRFILEGNGVFTATDSADIKDVPADMVLGEVRL